MSTTTQVIDDQPDQLSIEGSLLKKGDPDYEAARTKNFAQNAHNRQNSNTCSSSCHPALIAIVKTILDIQKCLHYANKHGMTVTVRTGGHNWFGCFLREDGLLIDMGQFRSLEIDAATETCTVGPAVLGQDLNEAASKYGLCFSAGHCVGVPLGGFLLGGGFGWFFPYFGYAAEHILEATIVRPDGEVITCSDENNVDWMYLVRGSASGFPGVVVSFKLRLAKLPKIVRSKTDIYPMEELANLVRTLDAHIQNHPKLVQKCELNLSLACTPPPLAQAIKPSKIVMLGFTCFADTEEEFQSMVEPIAKLPGLGEPCLVGKFEDKSFKELSDMLEPAYPPGQKWIARALCYESRKMHEINWETVQVTFQEMAPLGLSHLLLFWAPERLAATPGCYGKYSCKGFATLIMGVHSPNEDASPAQTYVDSMMQLLDPHVWKYDVLEHPLNEETFHKTYLEESEKVLRLCNTFDPKRIFFDPSTAKPSH